MSFRVNGFGNSGYGFQIGRTGNTDETKKATTEETTGVSQPVLEGEELVSAFDPKIPANMFLGKVDTFQSGGNIVWNSPTVVSATGERASRLFNSALGGDFEKYGLDATGNYHGGDNLSELQTVLPTLISLVNTPQEVVDRISSSVERAFG